MTVVFDGAACSVSGGPMQPGPTEILVVNTSSNSTAAMFLKLNAEYSVADVGRDVTSGRFDRWLLAGNDDPTGFDDLKEAIIPPFTDKPTIRPFDPTSGTWAVVCLDNLDQKAYLGSAVIEIR